MSASVPRFVLHGVRAGYGRGRDVLLGLDASLGRGRVVALLGENGSGKSTLLKLLAGLLSPRAGSLLFDGRPLEAVPRREAAFLIGYLPQGFEPFFPATAFEIGLLGRTPRLGPLSPPGPGDRAAARAALEEMDAAALSDVDVTEMSGGERQRVFLARVLAGEPEVLLLDEPTANLDPRHRLLLVGALRRRAERSGTAIVATHELDVAAAADEALLLSGGRLFASGPVKETLTAPLLSRLFGVRACVAEGPDGRPVVSLGPVGEAGGAG